MKSRTFFRFWYGWVGLVAALIACEIREDKKMKYANAKFIDRKSVV